MDGDGGEERGLGRAGDERKDSTAHSTVVQRIVEQQSARYGQEGVFLRVCVHLCLLSHLLQQGREVVRDLCHVIALRAVHIHIDAEEGEG